ncbi:hypothetical protein QFC21_003747 [Naganishia friedmannii]|uniref:Uncharacterized protein n=1 Tax=Naganishia friedmannii TaxID=89922 RepID=A0ACC2VL80_9TREE|nr:hypothetical protein QFC21_003747 [Naganishia friedmannii]
MDKWFDKSVELRVRTEGSLEEYGSNRSVEWTVDGHALYVSVPRINIDVPHILKSFPPGAGQGEVHDMAPEAIMTSTNIPELRFRNGGVVRLNGSVHSIAAIGGTGLPTAKKGLLIAIDDTGSPADDVQSRTRPFRGLLRLPSKIPEALVWKGTRAQPLPPYGWPYLDMDGEDQVDIDKWSWQEVGIDLAENEGPSDSDLATEVSLMQNLIPADIAHFQATKVTLLYTAITTLGNAFLVFPSTAHQDDQPWWDRKTPINRNSSWNSVQVYSVNPETTDEEMREKVTAIGVNQPFGLCTVGTSRGLLITVKIDHQHAITAAWTREYHDDQDIRDKMDLPIRSLQWTSDGYALAVQSPGKWALYSPFGDLISCDRKSPTEMQNGERQPEESTVDLLPKVSGLVRPAWLPGNHGLMMLHSDESPLGLGVEIVPFAKSSTTMQQDHFCRYRSLLLHDEIRVFRGADYPAEDLLQTSIDLFETVKVPLAYIIHQWPIRYTAISEDGKLLACAGRNGLTHYSFSSGRWKLFSEIAEEASFTVRGGLVWFHHVLIVAVHSNGHSERSGPGSQKYIAYRTDTAHGSLNELD